MTTYELMIKTNHYIINGGELNYKQKDNIVRKFLSARSTPEEAGRFYRGVRCPGNIDREGQRMYPVFFIPPYNEGKKLQTVIPMSPKTHILSANSYELEIIRLLHLLAPDNAEVGMMVKETLKRLKTTCFGYKGCYKGECFHSALITLRFLTAVAPDEIEWIDELVALYHNHVDDTRRGSGVNHYFELCMTELSETVKLN